MARTLKSLARDIRNYNRNLPQIGGKMARLAAATVVDVVVDRTPIDTTKAVSNWQVGIGGPVRSEIEAHIPGKLQSTAGPSTAITKKLAKQKILTYPGRTTIHITNNVPYIHGLNAGTISQQASGFVEAAVLAVHLRFKKPIEIRVKGL